MSGVEALAGAMRRWDDSLTEPAAEADARELLAALSPADKLAIAGITEERLGDVLHRLEVDGDPVWFVQRLRPDTSTGPWVPEGDMGGNGETDVARAILAALAPVTPEGGEL